MNGEDTAQKTHRRTEDSLSKLTVALGAGQKCTAVKERVALDL